MKFYLILILTCVLTACGDTHIHESQIRYLNAEELNHQLASVHNLDELGLLEELSIRKLGERYALVLEKSNHRYQILTPQQLDEMDGDSICESLDENTGCLYQFIR